MSAPGMQSDRGAVQAAAQVVLRVHANLEENQGALRSQAAELQEVWQSKGTAPKHAELMRQVDAVHATLQQEAEDIRRLLEGWDVMLEEGIAAGDRVLDEAMQLADLSAAGAGDAATPAGGGGYLELISSGETVAGGQPPAGTA